MSAVPSLAASSLASRRALKVPRGPSTIRPCSAIASKWAPRARAATFSPDLASSTPK
jgi:hypothetical protein